MAFDAGFGMLAWAKADIEREKLEKEQKEKEYKEYLAKGGIPISPERSMEEKTYVDADKPGTIDNGTATLWYIIIMLVGAVFNDRLLIWIVATVIWCRHINRKKRRQKECDEKHNGGNK